MNCPQQKIIEAYNRILPELLRVNVWSAASARNLKSRWREDARRQTIDFWERMFKYIRQSEFLMGNVSDWCANLNWIVKAQNFEKIMNQTYHRKAKDKNGNTTPKVITNNNIQDSHGWD